jgi:hypothetical protein
LGRTPKGEVVATLIDNALPNTLSSMAEALPVEIGNGKRNRLLSHNCAGAKMKQLIETIPLRRPAQDGPP